LQAKEAQKRAAAAAEEARVAAIVEEERARMLEQAGSLRQYLPHAVLINKKSLAPLHPAYLD
jgi:hypothetical protein